MLSAFFSSFNSTRVWSVIVKVWVIFFVLIEGQKRLKWGDVARLNTQQFCLWLPQFLTTVNETQCGLFSELLLALTYILWSVCMLMSATLSILCPFRLLLLSSRVTYICCSDFCRDLMNKILTSSNVMFSFVYQLFKLEDILVFASTQY